MKAGEFRGKSAMKSLGFLFLGLCVAFAAAPVWAVDGTAECEKSGKPGICEGSAFLAFQSSGAVHILVVGVTPTAGYDVCLRQGPEDIWPPIYDLVCIPPSGPVAQVRTPFVARASFDAEDPIQTVTVRDKNGPHVVRVHQADDPGAGRLTAHAQAHADIQKLPTPQACRVIDFESAVVAPIGIVPDKYFLIVKGIKPCINMEVRLVPLVYVTQPDYWGIEVVGCVPNGICLPTVAPYTAVIPLDGITGKQGIEVIGASKTQKLPVPPKKK